jgi:hypothetical protein
VGRAGKGDFARFCCTFGFHHVAKNIERWSNILFLLKSRLNLSKDDDHIGYKQKFLKKKKKAMVGG